jgi:hypothetical protein
MLGFFSSIVTPFLKNNQHLLANNGAIIRKPLPTIDESGVNVACQDSLFCNFGLDNKKITAIEMIILPSQKESIRLSFSVKWKFI